MMEGLLIAAVAGAAIALGCAIVATRGRRRWLWLLATPALPVLLLVGALMVPASDLDQVRLRDGRAIHLSLDPTPTDASYSLWVETTGGLYWRRLDVQLSYSEDGRFVGDERLVLSRDNRRLLVSRGGLWTDCIYVEAPHGECGGGPALTSWAEPGHEVAMRARSQQLEKLL